MTTPSTRRLALAIGAFALAACVVPGITEPVRRSTTAAATDLFASNKQKLLVCPSSESVSSSDVVGPLGGLVAVSGTSISIPAGALLEPVTVTVTVPASNYVEVDIDVAGSEHFNFLQTVTVAINYSRCPRTQTDPLTAWYIDSDTKALLEAMPSVDNTLTQTVTFTTTHLSGYALASAKPDSTETEGQ